jgi:hypothetical protein
MALGFAQEHEGAIGCWTFFGQNRSEYSRPSIERHGLGIITLDRVRTRLF